MTPLNSIIGQETAKKIILSSYNRDKLASTYLFYGSDGLGKWQTAIALAAILNCENPLLEDNKVSDACGKCVNCRQILNLGFSELHFALPLPPHKKDSDAIGLTLEYLVQKREESYRIITSTRQLTIPVNTARDIKMKTAIKPLAGVKRVVLFYQMEKMLAASADSLLKLIEEPPSETTIILTAQDQNNLLPTIQSRSQKIRFKPLQKDLIYKYLIDKYDVTEKKADFISGFADGSLGKAIEMITNEEQSSLRQVSFLMFKAIFQKDSPSAIAIVNEFINPNDRGGFDKIMQNWQSFLRDVINLKFSAGSSSLLNVDLKVELEILSNRLLDADDIACMIKSIKDVVVSSKRNVHIRPAISSLVLDLKKYIDQSA